jgi:hypothetical protein
MNCKASISKPIDAKNDSLRVSVSEECRDLLALQAEACRRGEIDSIKEGFHRKGYLSMSLAMKASYSF